MLAFILRRILLAVVILLASSFVVFAMAAKSGDPLATLRSHQPPPPQDVIDAKRQELHLDKPLVTRYGYWLGSVVHGDFGKTINGEPVGPELARRLGVTLRMVVFATVLAALLAIATGVFSAIRRSGPVDYGLTFCAFVFISIPAFWMAGLLKDLALRINDSVGSQVFSFVGEETPDLDGGFWIQFQDRFSHLILPTVALALITYAGWSRFQRSSMIDVLDTDYVRLARAKGLTANRALVRHGLRNALIPLTTRVAVDFGVIIGGAVITELVFGWHGMGEMLQTAVQSSDVNLLLAWLIATAGAVILMNLIADICYAFLDPRIRLA